MNLRNLKPALLVPTAMSLTLIVGCSESNSSSTVEPPPEEAGAEPTPSPGETTIAGGPAARSCSDLLQAIERKTEGFAPRSSSYCQRDADCTVPDLVRPLPDRNACVALCALPMTHSQAAEWTKFLSSDPNLNRDCAQAYEQGCTFPMIDCVVPEAVCKRNRCVDKATDLDPSEPPGGIPVPDLPNPPEPDSEPTPNAPPSPTLTSQPQG